MTYTLPKIGLETGMTCSLSSVTTFRHSRVLHPLENRFLGRSKMWSLKCDHFPGYTRRLHPFGSRNLDMNKLWTLRYDLFLEYSHHLHPLINRCSGWSNLYFFFSVTSFPNLVVGYTTVFQVGPPSGTLRPSYDRRTRCITHCGLSSRLSSKHIIDS